MDISNSDAKYNLVNCICYIIRRKTFQLMSENQKFKAITVNCRTHYAGFVQDKSTVCNHCSMLFLFPWFSLLLSCICTDTQSFHVYNVKREIVSLIVYKWPLLLQITVTVFYAILRLLGHYKHKLYLSKACPGFPFTLLKPSKKHISTTVIIDE